MFFCIALVSADGKLKISVSEMQKEWIGTSLRFFYLLNTIHKLSQLFLLPRQPYLISVNFERPCLCFENCLIILKSCHVNQALGKTVALCHSYIFLFIIQIHSVREKERHRKAKGNLSCLEREEPPCIHIELTKPSGTVFIKAKKTEREEDGSTQRRARRREGGRFEPGSVQSSGMKKEKEKLLQSGEFLANICFSFPQWRPLIPDVHDPPHRHYLHVPSTF